MKEKEAYTNSFKPTVSDLSQAIFTVNRHAKTAPNSKFLYALKKRALEKLIEDGIAVRLGLHFSRNPKLCKQRSDVVIRVGDYIFHMPPSKEDFKNLPHLGHLDDHTRNPKSFMNLHASKTLLMTYTGLKEINISPSMNHKTYQPPVFKRLGEQY